MSIITINQNRTYSPAKVDSQITFKKICCMQFRLYNLDIERWQKRYQEDTNQKKHY